MWMTVRVVFDGVRKKENFSSSFSDPSRRFSFRKKIFFQFLNSAKIIVTIKFIKFHTYSLTFCKCFCEIFLRSQPELSVNHKFFKFFKNLFRLL